MQSEIKGYIDHLNQHTVSGWIFSSRTNAPCRVSLYLGDQPIAFAEADRPRLDLIEIGLHKTGRCGFAFTVKSHDLLKNLGVLEVRHEGISIPMIQQYAEQVTLIKEQPVGKLTDINHHTLSGWVSGTQENSPVKLALFYKQKKIRSLSIPLKKTADPQGPESSQPPPSAMACILF